MPLAIPIAVLVLAVTAGEAVGSAVAGGRRGNEYTLAQAYYAGIITRQDLAQWGCEPAGTGDIVCAPTEAPWCFGSTHVVAGFTTDVMHSSFSECQASPYDVRVMTGFTSHGPLRIPRKY